MKKIIAYSLWGDNPKYTEGAVINAKQAKELYPGWIARFYCGESVPEGIRTRLRQAGAEVLTVPGINDNRGKFWRFWALEDSSAERILLRDTDSRLTRRERAAVAEWERSGLAGHIMRDHPYHSMPVMGGMWGCTGNIFQDIKACITAFSPVDAYDQDQIFLEKFIYPRLLAKGCCIHDAFFRYERTALPFPTPRKNFEFVGEAFGGDGKREEHWQVIRDYTTNPWHRFRFACKRLVFLLRLQIRRASAKKERAAYLQAKTRPS